MKKNINPKTLKGQDKLNRMLDLMGRMNTLNESRSLSELELIKKGPNGIVYGIIRENHDYFIKTTNKTSGQFLAEDFNYVGGLKNKYDERYHSYAEALKHLNIKFDMLNESYGVENNINIFESDGVAFGGGVGFGFVMEEEDEDKEDDEKEVLSDSNDDLEEQKKVLKVDAPKDTTPVETPEMPVEDEVNDDMDSLDTSGLGDMDTTDDSDETDMDDTSDEESDDMTKKIQKYTGKIGQMLRDMEQVDPDLEKYVINSIISALHLDEMDEGDKEDIIAKLEGEEEIEGDKSTEDSSDVDLDLDSEDITSDEEETTPKVESEKKVTKENRLFTKKQLLESFIRKNIKKSIKKSIRENREICEVCMGEGCRKCMNERQNRFDEGGYMMDEEEMVSYKSSGLKNPNKADLDKNNRLSRYERRRGEAIEKSMDTRRTRKRHIDEEDMSTLDAMEMGQGYLSATSDLDRDFDGIPNRLDLDNNGDGRLDFDMNSNRRNGDDYIELDIDFLRSNNPVKEPDIKKPNTKPGTGTDWDRIKRPKVNPKPKAEDGMERIRPSYRRRGMFR